MVISLGKGGTISLTKEAGPAGLRRAYVGVGWDSNAGGGAAYDLDVTAMLVGANGKAAHEHDFVFFGTPGLKHPSGAVELSPDVRDGAVEGDDEWVKVDLAGVPAAVASIVISVSIHDAEARGQSFGHVSNAYIRVENQDDGRELARFDLSEGASTATAIIFGELFRDDAEWKFRALGEPMPGLAAIVQHYGLNVG